MTNTNPAVVVRAELNGLGIVRSLSSASVPTTVVDTTRWRPAMWSRFCRTHVVETLDGSGLVDTLLALRKTMNARPVLFLTNDDAVKTVSEHRDQLQEFCIFRLPPRQMMATFSSKPRFLEFAEQNGLPVPQSIVLRQDSSTEKISALPFPVIIRSSDGKATIPGGKDLQNPIFTVKDATALSKRLLEFADEIVVQEWISGPDGSVCFVQFHRGREPESFTAFAGRKMAGHPSADGITTLCLPAPEVMARLEPLARKFVEVTEFEGLGSLEFKWDQRQHRFTIVGLTVGRVDWHEELATLSGVNIPLAAYRHELGQRQDKPSDIDRAVAWCESSLLNEKIPSLSPNTRVYDGYWRSNDPIPALMLYARIGAERAHRRVFGPAMTRVKEFYPGIERAYQSLVKAIVHRGKASTR